MSDQESQSEQKTLAENEIRTASQYSSDDGAYDTEKGEAPTRYRSHIGSLLTRAISRATHRQSLPETPEPPPDGGLQAWSICFMAHMVGFNTWGFINSNGILQTHYAITLGRSPSDIAWINSTPGFLTFFLGSFSGRLTDAGYARQTFAVGIVLTLLGIFAASEATTYWQLFLSQGLCFGIGCGLLYVPTMSVCATYFSSKQGIALSMVGSASACGGLVFGAMLEQLLPQVGLPWTLRIVGFVMLASYIPAFFIIVPRKIVKRAGPFIDWAAFKEPSYTLFAIGMFLINSSSYVPGLYVGSYGKDTLGIKTSEAYSLILIINGAAYAGRIPGAIIANMWTGPVNVVVFSTAVSSIILFGWIGVKSYTGLIVWDVLYGAWIMAAQGSAPSSMAAMTTDMSKMGVRMGMIFSVLSFANLVGPPISGALIQAKGGEYLYAQVFCGMVMIMGSACHVAARIAVTGWQLKVKI